MNINYKKCTIVLIVFLSLAIVKAQNVFQPQLMVEYTFYDNFFSDEFTSLLIMNSNESIFTTNLSKSSADKSYTKEGNVFLGGKRIDTYYNTRINSNEIISFEATNGKLYKIYENIPKLNWILNYEETKIVNDYVCNKATVKFRGRDYIAWYTKEIPVFFGPWKFSGLPGLILSLHDVTNTYQWIASKISTKNILNIEIPYTDIKEVSLIEFTELRKENLELLRARVRSKLPKGTELSIPTNPRNGLELIFEWEK